MAKSIGPLGPAPIDLLELDLQVTESSGRRAAVARMSHGRIGESVADDVAMLRDDIV